MVAHTLFRMNSLLALSVGVLTDMENCLLLCLSTSSSSLEDHSLLRVATCY